MDTGVVVAAPIHSAEAGHHGDARPGTGRGAEERRRCVLASTSEDLSDLVADKRYHPRKVACCRRVSFCLHPAPAVGACPNYKNGPDFRLHWKSAGECRMRRFMAGNAARKYGAIDVRMWVAAFGVALLSLVSSYGRAESSQVEPRCEVFSTAIERARCACALQHGGWVTEVQGRWRWIYPRRHQERHCATVTGH